MRSFFALFMLSALSCFALTPLKELSLEEKVGQVLIAHVRGETAAEEAKMLIQGTKVGGIIYYTWANGLTSPQQVASFSGNLQGLSRENPHPLPLFLAIDQEGGIVSRLGEGFTLFPGNKALGMTGDLKLAEKSARAIGEELFAVGINMNLAPVVDVNSNPRNPVIGIRSFAEDARTVLRFGESALRGYREASVITVLKHFPGHGDVEVDSHEDLPVVSKSLKALEQGELGVFAKLAPFADAIMTAHLLVPCLDEERCCTLSKKALSYLKEKIGFQGVVIADSLVMEGVLKRCRSVDEAAIQALEAGCDLLMLGGKQLIGGSPLELSASDVQRIHRSLVQAVQEGRISEARLNEAVRRILALKEKYLAAMPSPSFEKLSQCVGTQEHLSLAREVAAKALRVAEKSQGSFPSLEGKKVAIFAPQLLQDALQKASFFSLGVETHMQLFRTLQPSSEEVEIAKGIAKEADVLVICSYNAWKTPAQEALIQSLLQEGKPTALLVTRDPLDASLFPAADLALTTFSPTLPSLQAAYDQLSFFGEGDR